MKKLALTLAAVGLTLAAFGQGAVVLDNGSSAGGPVLDQAGNFYEGPYGLEVWYLNGTTVPNVANSTLGYLGLGAQGFALATTLPGKSNAGNAGIVQLGQLSIPGVTPKGGPVVLALAMWAGSAPRFEDAANAQGKGGVLAFSNPTSDYTAVPTPTPPTLTGWGSDLVMLTLAPVPEPTTFALAGLGAAALLIFRRRK